MALLVPRQKATHASMNAKAKDRLFLWCQEEPAHGDSLRGLLQWPWLTWLLLGQTLRHSVEKSPARQAHAEAEMRDPEEVNNQTEA